MKKAPRQLIGRILALALCVSLGISAFTACTNSGTDADTDTAAVTDTADTSAETEIEYIAEEGLPDPVFMRFGDFDTIKEYKVKFPDFDGNTEGNYMQKKDMMALELKYSGHNSFPNFRAMLSFSAKDHITKDHKYIRITYMTPDITTGSFTLTNNGTSGKITVIGDTSVSKGEWVTSNAVNIDVDGMLDRLINGIHLTFGYESDFNTSEFYIKEIGFFASVNQAYDYYDDKPRAEAVPYSVMTFGEGGNSAFLRGDTYGVFTENAEEGTLDITYAESTNHNVHYMSKVKFADSDFYSVQNLYVRALYCADMPSGDRAMLRIVNDKTGDQTYLETKVRDTAGEFVLSDVGTLTNDSAQRFAGAGSYTNLLHNSLHFTASKNDNIFRIKAIYFFPTMESAKAFTVDDTSHSITINGNDISGYTIVVDDDSPTSLYTAATRLADHIENITGHTLPIVTDNEPEGDFEILIGRSSRKKAEALNTETDGSIGKYIIRLDGDTLIFTSAMPSSTGAAVGMFSKAFLFEGLSIVPESIDITDKCNIDGTAATLSEYKSWTGVKNVSNPQVFTEDFDTDDGYFQEENNAQNWNYTDGAYTVDTDGYALSYLHVYEKNATLSAKWKYTDAGDGANAGLMLRYTADNAFVKAGYDFERGVWYIENREGEDFYLEPVAAKEAELTPDTWYELSLTVNGSAVSFSVNGELMLESYDLVQLTPGRVAFYAENASVAVDDAEVTLLSGQGTIMKDIVHTKLPDDEYREGGSVFEMNDGSLIYTHQSSATFKSLDNGHTWERTEQWTDTHGYVNILRLTSGDFMKIATKNGYKISQISSDDGKTWVDGGRICQTPFRGDSSIAAGAGNMNDKITQSGITGRIFYSQNYETTTSSFEGRKVFCEFFYSDDQGTTWTKSETDSWELPGNEDQTHFGECKILECADGTLRMYNSWNRHGCIVYSESTDYGVTWGPLVRMEKFICPCSSMQFVRDPYAENETTYYMVWVYGKPENNNSAMARSRLSLARSYDGKSWEFLGDIWRWESTYRYGNGGALVNHIVDPFIKVTEDYVLIGTGLSEKLGTTTAGDNSYHGAQRQHIWTVPKASLTASETIPPV